MVSVWNAAFLCMEFHFGFFQNTILNRKEMWLTSLPFFVKKTGTTGWTGSSLRLPLKFIPQPILSPTEHGGPNGRPWESDLKILQRNENELHLNHLSNHNCTPKRKLAAGLYNSQQKDHTTRHISRFHLAKKKCCSHLVKNLIPRASLLYHIPLLQLCQQGYICIFAN